MGYDVLAADLLLGQGDVEQELVQVMAKLGVADAVRCRFECVPEEEQFLHYAAADACVFPSTYEPFGIVCLEAMAMGKPVVVEANGVVGFTEQVTPKGSAQCGVHIDGSNPGDIACGLKETLQDPERGRQWGGGPPARQSVLHVGARRARNARPLRTDVGISALSA
jgi:glycosyltransferase involved in cell wall biosynthesis